MPASSQYHVLLDGQGYLVDLTTYKRSVARPFAPKSREGDAAYGDLLQASAWASDSWRGGFGSLEWDPAAPTRFADGNAIDVSFGDVRNGRTHTLALSSVNLFAFQAYKGALYGITTSNDIVYRSTDGSSWSQLADLSTLGIGATATALRSIWLHGSLLLIGSGSNGQLYSYDGATWTLYATITNATSVQSAFPRRYAVNASARSFVTGSDVDSALAALVGSSSLFNLENAVLSTVSSDGVAITLPFPDIDAIIAIGGSTAYTVYIAAVDDAVGVTGALFTYDGANLRLIQLLPDNAISSFIVYRGQLLAGARTRGIIWTVSATGLTELFTIPEVAMAGTPPAYANPIRSMAVDNGRLYVPFTDAQGPCLYQYDGTGWCRFSTGGTGTAQAVAAFNGALNLATSANTYQASATYAVSATLITSWFDAELASIDKVLTRFTIAHAPLTTGQSIQVEYALDDATGWTNLGTSNTVGASTKTFDFPTATMAKRIRFRFTLALTTNTTTPKLRAAILDYQLTGDVKSAWEFEALLEGTAQLPLIRLDQSAESLTGAQLSSALWTSRAKKQTLAFTGLDAVAKTIYFQELEETPAKQSDRLGLSTRGKVRLTES